MYYICDAGYYVLRLLLIRVRSRFVKCVSLFFVFLQIKAWQRELQQFHVEMQHWPILSIFRWQTRKVFSLSSHCAPSMALQLQRNQEPPRFLRSDAPYPPPHPPSDWRTLQFF